jgi:hypothetical protein
MKKWESHIIWIQQQKLLLSVPEIKNGNYEATEGAFGIGSHELKFTTLFWMPNRRTKHGLIANLFAQIRATSH